MSTDGSIISLAKTISIILLNVAVVSGCSTSASKTTASPDKFDPLGTAQAQASEIEYSTPLPYTPKETPLNFEPWVKKNSVIIQSIDSTNFNDLQFLEPLLEGKRIVQLGEDDHKTAEHSLMKVRLIKYLHEELGYEVIAFESGLLDCYLVNRNISDLDPIEAMEQSIFHTWHTEEVLPLFEYLKETSSSSNPLIFAGFDTQPSEESHEEMFGFYYELLKDLDEEYASEIGTLEESILTADSSEEFANIAAGDQTPIRIYEDLATYIDLYQVDLQQLNPLTPGMVQVAEQAAWSRAQFLEGMHLYDPFQTGEAFKVRDQSMAINVEFLAEELYPDKKIIIWAHNIHISEVSPFGDIDNMGSYLADYFGDELYTIGLIGYRPPTISISLDDLLYTYGEPYLYVALSSPDQDFDSSFEPLLNDHDLPLNDYYDALIFIDKITRPNYLESN